MLKGIGVSKGYGIGNVVIVTTQAAAASDNCDRGADKNDCDPAAERKRFAQALETFLSRNRALQEHVRQTVGEKESEIITGHMMMMQDAYTRAEVENAIDRGLCAEAAVEQVCDGFIDMFSSTDDEYTKQRAVDIRDVMNEMLAILTGREMMDLSRLPSGTVLVAKELTPSMTAHIDRENVVGIVTEIGSRTSHAAILARAMEIPAVLSVENATQILKDGTSVIINGTSGEILIDPDPQTKDTYIKMRTDDIADRKALSQLIGLPTCTADGIKVKLFGNIGTPEDAQSVREQDGEGIGLFRTEFLFMDRSSAPDENQQFEAYKKALLMLDGRPVVIRTLDIGGDKDIPYLGLTKEENPFLGFRGVRFCLERRDIFETQLRALIRASSYGPLSVMIPLVTGMEEFREVKSIFKHIMEEFDRQGIPYDSQMKLGVMIETPAAALVADILSHEVDFFSIGTNDLIGYTMAVDRGNAHVAHLYTPYAPAVLRSIQHVIACAKKAGIPAGMCGEAAADPLMIPLLLSFGLDEFSVSATSILSTRREILRWRLSDADRIADRVMKLDTAQDVQAELERQMNK